MPCPGSRLRGSHFSRVCPALFRVGLGLVLAFFALLTAGACQAPQPEAELPAPQLRRLTESQYQNAITDLLGEDLFIPSAIEPDLRSKGLLSVGASVASISPRGVEGFERAAYILAEQALAEDRRDLLVPCEPGAVVDPVCAATVLAPLARRALRRPVPEDELETLVSLAGAAASALGDFYVGLQYGFAAILQDPDFLYRPELGQRDPTGAFAQRYTDWDMASRLSFWLWDTIPDEALLDAAERGELVTEPGLVAQVERMLDDPRARRGLRSWFSDVLHLGELDELYKDPQVYVFMTDTLGASAREETLRLFEHLVFDLEADFRDILTTNTTFVNRELATLYAIRSPLREGFAEVQFDEGGPRQGLLGQASVLAINSHAVATSPTLRGKFIREVLMCQILPGPPAGVDTSIPPPTEEALTLRARVEQHLTDPACSGCHEPMDLPGLALEHFDGLGRYRQQDNGVDVDASGHLDDEAFSDLPGIAAVLREREEVSECWIRYLVRSALGIEEGAEQQNAVDWLHEDFVFDHYRLRTAVAQLALSPLFRRAGVVTDAGYEEPPSVGVPRAGSWSQLKDTEGR